MEAIRKGRRIAAVMMRDIQSVDWEDKIFHLSSDTYQVISNVCSEANSDRLLKASRLLHATK